MRVLVAYGSKRGGTAGLAAMIGEALAGLGETVEVSPAVGVLDVSAYDAVIVAGALYANRWHKDARRFVRRHAAALRTKPVWLVSSGPLDDSARAGSLPPARQVAAAAALVGARDAITFGGFLAPEASGLLAGAMAKKQAGDWRDPEQVAELARSVRAALAAATG